MPCAPPPSSPPPAAARSRATRWRRPSRSPTSSSRTSSPTSATPGSSARSGAPTAAPGAPRPPRLVRSRRGADGGYWLAQPAEQISLADVTRAVEGPLASVRGEAPEDVEYPGAAEHLQDIWIAVRASVRSVVEHVTLADLASGNLPPEIKRLGDDPEAWVRR